MNSAENTAVELGAILAPAPQLELPLAIIAGTTLTELPKDLYIPPDALRVFLDAFEGPLDLLLYLIQKQNLDILNIPITQITRQYLRYIELMQTLQLDLAGEYLVMAALLLEIKSRLLLPRPETEEADEEGDLRSRLIQQLQEYALIKQAAEALAQLPVLGRDTFLLDVDMPDLPQVKVPPKIPLQELLLAMQDVLLRIELHTAHQITREPLSVRERMTLILDRLQHRRVIPFPALFTLEEGRAGAVVTLLAILELTREKLLEIHQPEAFGAIQVQRVSSTEAETARA